MQRKLSLFLCKIFEREAQEIVQLENWSDIDLHYFSEVCSYCKEIARVKEEIDQVASQPEHDVISIGCTPNCLNLIDKLKDGQLHSLGQCLYLVIPQSIFNLLIQDKNYLVAPGWLVDWQNHLDHWGLDQATARMMFQEVTRKIILLDTGVYPGIQQSLEDFGDYLQIPVDILPVGLEYMSLYLYRIISDWQHKQAINQVEEVMAESNRKSADYEMALDLLTNLTRVMNEEKAISEIIDLFTMLFSADMVSYLPIVNGRVTPRGDHSFSDVEISMLQQWVSEGNEMIRLTDQPGGFYLKLEYLDTLLGVLSVQGLRLPEYTQRYINLSLSIARLCGLAISNTHMYHNLQVAERVASREREISETLRQVMEELVSQNDLEKMLAQTLISLNRIMDYSFAALYLLNDEKLVFKKGIEKTTNDELKAFHPPLEQIAIESNWLGDGFQNLNGLPESIQTQITGISAAVRSWIGLPLKSRDKKVGLLIAGRHFNQEFTQREIQLAQTFANEVSAIIENTRLFEEIRLMAITDGLTGLFTRRHFYEMAVKEFKRTQRYFRPLSAIMLDVDHFKRINDTYGHMVGDKVLIEISRLCRLNIRACDLLGRFGGEEIVFLLPETEQEGAYTFANRLREIIGGMRIATPLGEVQITASFGVASNQSSCQSLEELLRRSDVALYQAKQAGRNCVKVYSLICAN